MSLKSHRFVPLEELDVQVTCAWLWERGDNQPGERVGGRDAEACEGECVCVCKGCPSRTVSTCGCARGGCNLLSNIVSLLTAFCCCSGELACPAPSSFGGLSHPACARQLRSTLSDGAAVAGVPLPFVPLRSCFRM